MKKRFLILMSTMVLLAVLTTSLLGCTKKIDETPVSTAITEETTVEDSTAAEETTAAAKDATTKKTSTSLAGSWQDRVSQRANMDIKSKGGNAYSILVHWGSTYNEYYQWTMNATYDPATGVLSYSGCKKEAVMTDDNGEDSVTDVFYENGTGKFVMKNGELSWQADNDPDTSICVFVR